MVVDELPRKAFGVRGACSRFTTAPASWTHSKRFAQFGRAFAALHCNSPTCSRAANNAKQCRSADILVRQFLSHRLADKNIRAPAIAPLPRCVFRDSADGPGALGEARPTTGRLGQHALPSAAAI